MSADAQRLNLFPSTRNRPALLLGVVAAGSFLAALSSWALGWPRWAAAAALVLPWLPLFGRDVAGLYRHQPWLALFLVLVVTQVGHVVEHITQMLQIHVLNLPPAQSRGVIGPLDIEWVHFGWNSWVFLVLTCLVIKMPRNAWLMVAFALAAWHQVEHGFIITRYLQTGAPGLPGLLAEGGAVLGGLPIPRPDLHFLYNVFETVPLVIALMTEVRRGSTSATAA